MPFQKEDCLMYTHTTHSHSQKLKFSNMLTYLNFFAGQLPSSLIISSYVAGRLATSAAILAALMLKKISSSSLAYLTGVLIVASSNSLCLNSAPIQPWTCSITLCISGEYVGKLCLSNPSSSSLGRAASWILGLSNEYTRWLLPCHSDLFGSFAQSLFAFVSIFWICLINSAVVVPPAGPPPRPCMPRPKRLLVHRRFQFRKPCIIALPSLDLAFYFHHHLNQILEIELADMGSADERQCFWYRWCLVHLTFQTGKSVVDNGRNSLDCRVCGLYVHEDHHWPSSFELRAYQVMAATHLASKDWIVECRVLGRNFSSVDIWIQSHNLLVMLDGECHFGDMLDTSYSLQREVDIRFNTEAKTQRFHVLRLHYRDDPRLILAMMAKCKTKIAERRGLLVFSRRYPERLRSYVDQSSRHWCKTEMVADKVINWEQMSFSIVAIVVQLQNLKFKLDNSGSQV